MASSVAQADLKRDKAWMIVIALIFLLAFGTVFKPLRRLPKTDFSNVYFTYRYSKPFGPGERVKEQLSADVHAKINEYGLAPDSRVSFPSTTEIKIRMPLENRGEVEGVDKKLQDILDKVAGRRFGQRASSQVDTAAFPDEPVTQFIGLGLYRPKLNLRLGLDLQGGVHLVLKARTQNVEFEYKLADNATDLSNSLAKAEQELKVAPRPEAEAAEAAPKAADKAQDKSEPAPATQPDGGEPIKVAQAPGEGAAGTADEEAPVEALAEAEVTPQEAEKLADPELRARVEDVLVALVTQMKGEYKERIGDIHAEVVNSNVIIMRTYVNLKDANAAQKQKDHANLVLGTLKRYFPATKQLGEPELLKLDTRTAMRDVTRIIGERIDRLGVSESTVREQGEDRVVVELPGIRDPDEAVKLLGTTARMEFRKVPDRYDVQTEQSASGRNEINFVLKDTNKNVPHELVYYEAPEFNGDKNVLVGSSLAPGSVRVEYDQDNKPAIGLTLDKIGARRFDAFANENQNAYIAIYLDRKCIDARVVKERHYGGAVLLTGGFGTVSEATNLKILLDAGALPIPVDVVEQRTVSATLGADSVRQSSRAALWGLGLILILMTSVYKLPGLLADLSLFGYCLLVLACLVMFDAVLTLPGILGIVLSIGMAVDANVIVFERLKEELRESATRPVTACIKNAYERALPAIVDGNVTTLIIGVILFLMGTGPIRGFAVTLSIGILCSIVSGLWITRKFQNLFAASSMGSNRRVYRG